MSDPAARTPVRKTAMSRYDISSRWKILSIVFLVAWTHAPQASTFEDCERWIASAPYRSREGLLQMFLQAARTEHVSSASLDRSVMSALAGKIETMFPLERTESVAYSDSVLEIRFDGPVEVYVPGTWRQTKLSMSRRVRFRVRPWAGNPTGVEFEIVQGSLRLDFCWLARRISAMPDHLQGRRLWYWSDDAHRSSGVTLEQETRFAPGTFRIERGAGSLEFDCPRESPIAFTDTTADYFGMHLLWRGDMMRPPDGKWVRDPDAARRMASLRRTLSATIDSADGKPTLVLLESLAYRLEERKGSLGEGFRLENGK